MGIISGYIGRALRELKNEVLVLPSKTIILVVCLALFLIPAITSDAYILRVLILACIFAVFAASWDLLSGFTGQMNFGHALFFGVAAYTAGLLNLHLGLAPWLTIPIGAVAAVLVGLVVGIPCLRLRGPYLALVTLAFPLILTGIVYVFPTITGGERGIFGIAPLTGSRVVSYYICLVVMLVSGFIMWKITGSKTGIIFHAIREDELAVRASGVNTTRYKLLAFMLSGLFAGIAGGLFVHFMRIASPISTLHILVSFQVIIWAIFGGIATIYGPMIGVFILVPLTEFLSLVPVIGDMRMLLFALVILLVLMFMPEGVTTWVRDKMEKECPRCRVRNVAVRKSCRVCMTDLE